MPVKILQPKLLNVLKRCNKTVFGKLAELLSNPAIVGKVPIAKFISAGPTPVSLGMKATNLDKPTLRIAKEIQHFYLAKPMTQQGK
jgi:hypothetical protein